MSKKETTRAARPDHKAKTLANKQARIERELRRQAEAAQHAANIEAQRLQREEQERERKEMESYARTEALNTTNQKWVRWLQIEVFHFPKYGFAPVPYDAPWWSKERDVRLAKEAAARLRMKREMGKTKPQGALAAKLQSLVSAH